MLNARAFIVIAYIVFAINLANSKPKTPNLMKPIKNEKLQMTKSVKDIDEEDGYPVAILYEDLDEEGRDIRFTANFGDFAYLDFSNVASSICYNGIYVLYDATDFNGGIFDVRIKSIIGFLIKTPSHNRRLFITNGVIMNAITCLHSLMTKLAV